MSHGPILEAAVEHFSDFLRFCSTFDVARADFGAGGRIFFQFLEILFYFQCLAPLNLDQPVDKKETFPRFLSTFGSAQQGWLTVKSPVF